MGSKSAGSQTTTTQPDALTQDWRKLVFGLGLGATGMPGVAQSGLGGLFGSGAPGISPMGPRLQPVPGVSPLTQQAESGYQGALSAGNLGLGALSGNQGAISQLMNPYQSNVLDAINRNYGQLAANTTNAINDQATQAGAFGGARHGVAEGVALSQLNKDQANQMAGLQYQGYNDAMSRAGGLANLGLGAAGQLASLGDYNRQVQMSQDPAMRNLQILQGLMTGMPFGQSQSTPMTRNALGGALGGAGAGMAFGPIGAGIGGLIGLLGG